MDPFHYLIVYLINISHIYFSIFCKEYKQHYNLEILFEMSLLYLRLLKDLDKIQKFKNPSLDIAKSKINKNSKYKIFLNKTLFNNLLDQGFIKYKLTDSKKECIFKREMESDLYYQWLLI